MIDDTETDLQWLNRMTARIRRLQQAEEHLRHRFQGAAESALGAELDESVLPDRGDRLEE